MSFFYAFFGDLNWIQFFRSETESLPISTEGRIEWGFPPLNKSQRWETIVKSLINDKCGKL